MLSIIICSISPKYLETLTKNIHQTIGVEYEIIAIDNRERDWPIAKVYNYGAQQAKYSYLFFVHEDVRLHSHNWGEFIIRKLAKPDCGVIGFAGSKVRLSCYSGWYQYFDAIVSYLYQGGDNAQASFVVANAYLDHPFEEVIVVDGLGMFVRKEVWEQCPFDDGLLTGFHCYDIDFSLQVICADYKNYVCCSNQFLIEHFSMGNFNNNGWLSMTISLHDKWKHLLPMKLSSVIVPDRQLQKHEENISYSFLKQVLKSDLKYVDKQKVFKEFVTRSFSRKHFWYCISAFLKYMKYVSLRSKGN